MTAADARWDEVATLLHALLALGVVCAVFWAADRTHRHRQALRDAAEYVADRQADAAHQPAPARRQPAWAQTDDDHPNRSTT